MKIPNNVNPTPKNPPVRPVTVDPRAPVAPTSVTPIPQTTPTPPGARQIQPIPPIPRGSADPAVRRLT
jgi:hypothetical protein